MLKSLCKHLKVCSLATYFFFSSTFYKCIEQHHSPGTHIRQFVLNILKYKTSYKFGEKKAEQNMDKIYKIMKAVDKVSVELLFHNSQCLS